MGKHWLELFLSVDEASFSACLNGQCMPGKMRKVVTVVQCDAMQTFGWGYIWASQEFLRLGVCFFVACVLSKRHGLQFNFNFQSCFVFTLLKVFHFEVT